MNEDLTFEQALINRLDMIDDRLDEIGNALGLIADSLEEITDIEGDTHD